VWRDDEWRSNEEISVYRSLAFPLVETAVQGRVPAPVTPRGRKGLGQIVISPGVQSSYPLLD